MRMDSESLAVAPASASRSAWPCRVLLGKVYSSLAHRFSSCAGRVALRRASRKRAAPAALLFVSPPARARSGGRPFFFFCTGIHTFVSFVQSCTAGVRFFDRVALQSPCAGTPVLALGHWCCSWETVISRVRSPGVFACVSSHSHSAYFRFPHHSSRSVC